jgi:hypothetical protein
VSEAEKTVPRQATSAWDRPGTKKWYWFMRIVNLLLFIVPFYPLIGAVGALVEPQALVRASTEGVRATSTQGEVSSVIVELAHPSFYDYLLLSGPGFIASLGLAAVCRALYRIEVNYNGNPRKYTDRDLKVLRYAGAVAVLIWLPMVVLALLGTVHFHGAGSPNVSSNITLLIVVSSLMAYMKSHYQRARSFYEEMEKGV